jgi:hypothetical protein
MTVVPAPGPWAVYVGAAPGVLPAIAPSDVIELMQEDARQRLATWLLALLTVVVVFSLFMIAVKGQTAQIADALEATFGPILALIGTVIGFYFGTKTVTK